MAHKLLLADDSVTIQRVIELTFADEDVEVTTVGDGQLAIERLDNDPPDIVLADVDMPKHDGYEIAAYIKSRPKLAHIPVVLLTGAFEPIDSARAAAAGSNDVLAKPFEPQMVINRVKELLTRKSQPAAQLDAPWPRPADGGAHEPLPSQTAALFASPEPAAEAAEIVSLDDYFDQLDAAFSNLQSEPAPSRNKADQMEWATVAIEAPAPTTDVKRAPEPAAPSSLAPEMPQLDVPDPFDFQTKAPAFVAATPAEAEPASAPEHDVTSFPGMSASAVGEPPLAMVPTPLPIPPVVPAPEPPSAERPTGWIEAAVPATPVAAGLSIDPAVSAAQTAVMPDPQAMPPHVEPASTPSPKPVAASIPRTGANPFATLSAAKAEAAARPPVITDEVIEEVVSRVLQRLSDKVVRETVTEIVSQTAERLVQEEIERIKQAQ